MVLLQTLEKDSLPIRIDKTFFFKDTLETYGSLVKSKKVLNGYLQKMVFQKHTQKLKLLLTQK